MRLLASVNTLMNSQGRTLDELFAAIRVVADMRSDSSMNTFYVTVRQLHLDEFKDMSNRKQTMTGQITASSKTLSTCAAWVRLGSLLSRLGPCGLRRAVRHIGCHLGESHAGRSHVGLRHVERSVHGGGRTVGTTVL